MPTMEMFDKPARKKPRIIAHMIDCGTSPFKGGNICAEFQCKKCGWNSGWRHGLKNVSEVKRGIPCEKCND